MKTVGMFSAIRRPLFLLVCAIVLTILSGQNRFYGFVAGIVWIHVLWASGMNIIYGYTGLLPLVFAGVSGIAAYATVLLTMKAGWNFWIALPIGAIIGAVAGAILGLPSLRLKAFYFTLSTLVIQTVLSLGFVYFVGVTNGDTGISQIPAPEFLGQGRPLYGFEFEILLCLISLCGIFCMWLVRITPLGTRLIAIREDEVLAEAIGIDVTFYKLAAFFIASLYAGVGGALYASFVGFISPRNFDILMSMNIWLLVAFGGRGTLAGPVIGALILAPVPFLLQEYDTLKDVIYGTLIIAVVVLMPGGIYGEIERLIKKYLRGGPIVKAAKTAS